MRPRKLFRSLRDMKAILMSVTTPLILLPILYTVEGQPGRCAYAVSILVTFWVLEVLPFPVTSMLPAVLFPLLSVLTTRQVCAEYIKDPSITIIGIFGLVAAIERWGLHRRVALGMLKLIGTKPHWLILGMLVCTSLLSMFITAGVTALMSPIVKSIMDKLKNVTLENDYEIEDREQDDRSEDEESDIDKQYIDEIERLHKALSLCIGYGAILGSVITLTGGPSNFVAVGLIQEFYRAYGLQSKLTFVSWLVFAGPIGVIVIFLTWIWFVILFLKGKGLFRRRTVTGKMVGAERRVQEHLQQEYSRLGPWSYPEVMTLAFLLLLVVLFLTEDLYFIPGWNSVFEEGFVGSSVTPSLLMVLLFIIPAKSPTKLLCGSSEGKKNSKFSPIINWTDVTNTLPLGVVLILGASFAMVKACQESGLTPLIGEHFKGFVTLEPWVLTLVVTSLTTFLAEFISNSAAITMLLPIVGQMAILANLDPLALLFPLTIAAKCAFMMPIATPPNTIAYSLGALTIKDMATAGFALNILTLLTLNVAAHSWGQAYFQWDVIPDEMRRNVSTI
ncbi:Na(+)/citrate cotransporter-like isoform X2 [Liolophura sinensis]|uniref:Na(+)/citrate cotransporter-like isoform X2 n=1 Tax=Liolophura sinensis TaxID=3198878 RepID=UPI00315981D0